jgi:chromate reductase, NAD(P)H dehydrogenase (quinone)
LNTKIHILGISGSLRKGSTNTGLLRAAGELLPEGMALEIFDLSSISLYNRDVEERGLPESVTDFKARIVSADALLIATPEYNYSVSGVLKNAIDWASRPRTAAPINGKPVAIMGAGGMWGTVRAQMHLRQICLHNNMHVLGKPEVYVPRAWEKFDAGGRLIDEPTRERIRELLDALAAWTRRLQAD